MTKEYSLTGGGDIFLQSHKNVFTSNIFTFVNFSKKLLKNILLRGGKFICSKK